MPGVGDFKIRTPYGKQWATYLCRAMDCEAVHDELVDALKRALFVLESSAMPFANGAGTVDFVRAALARADAKSHQPAEA